MPVAMRWGVHRNRNWYELGLRTAFVLLATFDHYGVSFAARLYKHSSLLAAASFRIVNYYDGLFARDQVEQVDHEKQNDETRR